MYPHPITIVNRLEGHRGVIELYPTIMPKAHYQDLTGVKLGNTEQITNTSGYVQVPYEIKGYTPPNVWKELADKTGKWTIQENDFVLKGEHDLSGATSASLKELGARVVERYEFVDYGISIPWHWGVYLK